MIRHDDVIKIGKTLRPHGLKGELSVATDFDIDFDALRCVVLDIDGILVPFFIESSRPKSTEVTLLTIDGVDSESASSELSNKDLYILAEDAENAGLTTDDEDVLYLSELPGYTVADTDGSEIGKVKSIDDSTSNVILIVASPADNDILIPFAEEFVVQIDKNNKIMVLDIPEGILDLNN